MRNDLLEQDVHVKDYGGINIPLTDQQRNTSIPEPDFIPPPFNMDDIPNGADGGENYSQPANSGGGEDDGEEMSQKERNASAKAMADMILNAYGAFGKYAEDFCKISNRKIAKMQLDGDIDTTKPLSLPNGALVEISEFVTNFNKGIDGAFSTNDEFNELVRPLLIKILAKKGVGLSDEELLAYYVFMDLVGKGRVAFELLATKKQMLSELKDISAMQREIIAGGFTNSSPVVNTNEPPKQTANVVSPLSGEGKDSLDGEVEKPNSEVKPKKAGRGRPKKENKE